MIGYNDPNFNYNDVDNQPTTNDDFVAINPNSNMIGPTARQRLHNYLIAKDAYAVVTTR